MNRKPLTAFLVVAFVLLSVLVCGGCKKDSAALNPTQVVEQFVDAFQELDIEKAKTFLSGRYLTEFADDFNDLSAVLSAEEGDAEAEATKKVFIAILENSEFTVTGHSAGGNSAVVNMENKIPDLENMNDLIFAKLFDPQYAEVMDFENMTEEESTALLTQILVEVLGEVARVEQKVQVPLVLEDGAWKIDGEVVSDLMSDFDL